jgi:hypothetical protein
MQQEEMLPDFSPWPADAQMLDCGGPLVPDREQHAFTAGHAAFVAHVLGLAHRIACRSCARLDPTDPVQSSGAATLLPSQRPGYGVGRGFSRQEGC